MRQIAFSTELVLEKRKFFIWHAENGILSSATTAYTNIGIIMQKNFWLKNNKWCEKFALSFG